MTMAATLIVFLINLYYLTKDTIIITVSSCVSLCRLAISLMRLYVIFNWVTSYWIIMCSNICAPSKWAVIHDLRVVTPLNMLSSSLSPVTMETRCVLTPVTIYIAALGLFCICGIWFFFHFENSRCNDDHHRSRMMTPPCTDISVFSALWLSSPAWYFCIFCLKLQNNLVNHFQGRLIFIQD